MIKESVRSNGSRRVQLVCDGKTRTVQSAKDECDINKIMSRYAKTGLISHVNGREARYGDFTGVVDYQTAVDAVRAAEVSFMALPSSVRSRFDNDPGQLIAFLSDRANLDEAVELGLVQKPVQEKPGEGSSEPTKEVNKG